MPLESELQPGTSWQFDEAVAAKFDDMLERSIPEYETMREAVTLIASGFLDRTGTVVDLGCSRGEALARIAALDATEANEFVGLEIATPMVEAARARFAGDDRVRIIERDLRAGLALVPEIEGADAILSILTLMFVPVNYRIRLVNQVYERLRKRGVFILVEKVLAEGPDLDDVFNANYHKRKVDTGYTPDEIERKRLSLEGVLVPLTSSTNAAMLERAGFAEVDVFWRWMNFVGWAAVK